MEEDRRDINTRGSLLKLGQGGQRLGGGREDKEFEQRTGQDSLLSLAEAG